MDAAGAGAEDPEVRLTSAELRRVLRELPVDRRRALVSAVRAGMPAPERADATLAIALARRGQRNAQLGWFVFPVGGIVLLLLGVVGAAGVVIGSVIGAYLSTLLLARAVRAERLNRGLLLAPADDAEADGTAGRRGAAGGSGGRLPVRRRPAGPGRPTGDGDRD